MRLFETKEMRLQIPPQFVLRPQRYEAGVFPDGELYDRGSP